MHCEDFRTHLDDFEAGRVLDPTPYERHLLGCAACWRYREDVVRMRQALQQLDGPPETAAVWMRAQRRAQQIRAGERIPRTWMGWSAAAAVAVAVSVAALLGGTPLGPDRGGDLATEGPRVVAIAIESPESRDDVRFTVQLPDGVELKGFPGERQVAWHGRLEQGANRLRLPLQTVNGPGGEVVARIEHDGRSQELRLAVGD